MNSNFDDIDLDSNYFNYNYSSLSHGLTNDQYYDSDKFNDTFSLSHRPYFKLIHVNVRSLPKNGNTLVAYLETLKLKFDIVCFSETWLNSTRCIDNIFSDFNQFHSMRPNNQPPGGGVAIFVHKSFVSTEFIELSCNNDTIECVFVKLSSRAENVVVGAVYRKPVHDNATTFVSSLSSKIASIDSRSRVLLAGDFNFNLLNLDNDGLATGFIDSLLSLGLIPTISKPTRNIVPSISLLDNVFVSNSLAYSSGILNWDISDHYPVFIFIKDLFSHSNEIEIIRYRVINEITLYNLASDLENYNFDEILCLPSLDDAVNKLDDTLLAYFNAHCPIITKRVTRKDREKPWINGHIKRLIKTRQQNYHLYKQGNISLEEWRYFRNYVSKQIIESKKLYFSNFLKSIKNNMKKTWSALNGLLKPNLNRSDRFIKSILLDGTIFEDNVSICDSLNAHFSSVGRKIAQNFSPSNHHIPTNPITNSFFFNRTTADEIGAIIDKLKNKSCNIEFYPAKVLKYINPIISPVLSVLINRSLENAIFPSKFKLARVVPLHKSDEKNNVNNYRPISILHILGKIFERAVYNQLEYFLDKFNLLHPSQFGFRKNRSTIQAIVDQLEFVYHNLDVGNAVISVFLDFSKAFDCLDHEILLKKLNHYGIRGVTNRWFRSYLSNRNQCVTSNNATSSFLPITHGVPQGSILGPLLFLLFINDFPSNNSFFKYSLFADDSTLTCKFENKNENFMKREIERELVPINDWLKMNKIKINLSKSNFILFSYGKRYDLNKFKFGDGEIKVTESTKFLGIIMDKNLNFKSHTSAISTKISKVVGLLFRLNNFLPYETLLTLYNTLLVPHLIYGIEVWLGALKLNQDRIFKLQKKAVRAVNSLPYNEHTNDYFKSMEILKVKEIYQQRLLLFMFSNYNITAFSEIHAHNTRNRNDLILPQVNRTRTQSSLFYQGVKLWNSLPEDIRSIQYVGAFKNSIKCHFLSEY